MGRAVVVAGVLAAMAGPAGAELDPVARVETVARVALDVEARTLRGEATIGFDNPTAAPLHEALVWLYPNRHARPPAGLDDVTIRWVYPRRVSRGSMTLEAVRVDGTPTRAAPRAHREAGPGTLVAIRLPRPLPPGGRARLALRFRVALPERYGWGCAEGGCALAGGYHPALAALDRRGFDLAAPPATGAVEVAVALAEPASIVLGDAWSGDGARRLHARAARAAYLPLLTAPRLHERALRIDGARLRVLTRTPSPPVDENRDRALPYSLEDRPAELAATVAECARLLARWTGRPADALTVVEAPLRGELAVAHPGAVWLSDRYVRIWPAERFRKLHRRVLVRAVFAGWLAPRLAAAGLAPSAAWQAADAAGAGLAERWTVERYARREHLGQILSPLSFVPAIDQLLYAPQTLFADAYFGGRWQPDPWRDDLRRFASSGAGGRLLYEKLRDLLGGDAVEQVVRAIVRDQASLPVAAAAVHGAPLGWFFAQWARRPGRYDVRLGRVDQRPVAAGVEVTVRIDKRVAAGEVAPVEPVDVVLIDRRGRSHRRRWSGRGATGIVRAVLPTEVDDVRLDPDGRLAQEVLPGEHDDPRFDDVREHPLRFVYHSFGVLLNVTDLSALLAADFSLGRVRDVENGTRFLIYRGADTSLGGRVAYTRGFGPQVTTDRLLAAAGLALGVARLDPDFFATEDDPGRSATAFSATVSLGADTLSYPFEPLERRFGLLHATTTATRRDARGELAADLLWHLEVGATASATTTPVLGHTLALELGATAALGAIEGKDQLIAVGGATGVRGYAPGSRFGRGLAMARGEYRHGFVAARDWNLGHYTALRGFGGAAFVDVAAVAPCDGYLPGRGGLAAAAGYGLTFFYDNFGTLGSLMRLDAAVRLTGRGPTCLGAPPDEPPRLQIYLAFLPPF